MSFDCRNFYVEDTYVVKNLVVEGVGAVEILDQIGSREVPG